jgi:predicted transglutaminase-like cysteine proteinase
VTLAFPLTLLKLTPQRAQELIAVNDRVNSAIKPERNDAGIAGERWILVPSSGDCNDYAVTKRHELIARGGPPVRCSSR